MKPRTIILLGVAILCGLAAMYMTNRLLADRGATPPPVNTVKVLVSKQKISAWTPIKKPEDLFEEKDVPEGTYSTKVITDFKDLKGQALKQPLAEQMPVTKDDLASADQSLQGMLKEGQRAIAIKVTPESLVGGFVLPGSHVDIMFIKKRGDSDSESQIILQDMLVLAVDTKKTRDAEEQSILGSTATLAATAEESEELALAGSLGDLRLLLRTQLDATHTKYRKITIDDLARQHHPDDATKPDGTDNGATDTGSSSLPTLPNVAKAPTPAPTPAVAVEPPPPAEPTKFTMKIINSDTVTKSIFVWDDKNNCWEGGEPAAKPADAGKTEDAPKTPKAPAAEKAPVG